MRLKYVNLLIEACLHGKVKYGCEFWAILCEKDEHALDNIQVKVLKRVLELPYSTPSAAVKYEFGVIDLSLVIKMEKVLLAVKTLRSDDERKAKQLLQVMLQKKVPGFATEVMEISSVIFGTDLGTLVEFEGDLRVCLKDKLIDRQRNKLMKEMMLLSKADNLLLNSFCFNGKRKSYLDLPFHLARVVFMVRCRMLPTKENFPGRWSGTNCTVCGRNDSDEHLFSCPGFMDLLEDVALELFFSVDVELKVLQGAAEKMLKVVERLQILQERSHGDR